MSRSPHLGALAAWTPEHVLTNNDLAQIVDTSDSWIVERTGIHERRKMDSGENASDLGLRAARQALELANIEARELTHAIAATCTPDYLSPSVACIVSGELGAGNIMAFDMQAACTGFIYGLSVCGSIIAGAPESKILFVCVEALTRRLNWLDRGTCVLFGDAASACVISGAPSANSYEIIDVLCQSDGQLKDLIIVGGGTACQYAAGQPVDEAFFLSMQGRDTYRHAVRQMVQVCETILRRNGMDIGAVDLFVPHQANIRIIEAVGQRLKIPAAKVFTNLEKYGNTSAASIPLALKEARDAGRLENGFTVLATAFGAGLTWGAALLKFNS